MLKKPLTDSAAHVAQSDEAEPGAIRYDGIHGFSLENKMQADSSVGAFQLPNAELCSDRENLFYGNKLGQKCVWLDARERVQISTLRRKTDT